MGDKPVTMDVVKTLLQSQAEAFKASFVLLIQDVKDEMKSIRNDINDLKASLRFPTPNWMKLKSQWRKLIRLSVHMVTT